MQRRLRAAVAPALTLTLALSAAFVGVAGPAAASGAAHHRSPRDVVTTDRGAVRGATADGVQRFLGIPYAAPPTGALRWAPPTRAQAWSGVRDATRFGNPCPVLPSTNGPRSETEDCRVVNVWRPARHGSAHGGLPVHVFIHGGGLVTGSGAQNDESKLVRETGVVGVSFNYRLGVFRVPPDRRSRGREPGRRQLRLPRPAGRAALGAAQHRGLRRPPRPGDDRRRVRRRLVGVRPPRLAGIARAVRPRDDPERLVLEPDARPCRRAWHGVRRRGRLSRPGDRRHVPAGRAGGPPPRRERRLREPGRRPLRLGDAELPRGPRGRRVGRPVRPRPAGDRLPPRRGPDLRPGLHRRRPRGVRGLRAGHVRRAGRRRPRPGHAAELAYIWPSFDNGTPIAPLFDAGERRLAHEMTAYWGGFTRTGHPSVAGQERWPRCDARHGRTLSLRAGGRSTVITNRTHDAEHRCGFWATMPPLDVTA